MEDIVRSFAKKGILVDREALKIISEFGLGDKRGFLDFVVKSCCKMVGKEFFLDNEELLRKDFGVVLRDEGVSLICSSARERKIVAKDFVNHFRSRYEKMRGFFEEKNFENLCSIRKLSGSGVIIAIVLNKRLTKNKNILLEVEDLSGSCLVVVNKERGELFKLAEGMMEDDVIAISLSGGRNGMFFAENIFYPDSVLNEKKYGKSEEYFVFSGDFHVGSVNFLEERVIDFVSWINGDFGSEEMRDVAKRVKCLFLAGDNIDGVGVYSGQINYLKEKSIREQYKKIAEMLGKIRKDVKIFVCPGQHDAVWVGEVQHKIGRRWAEELHNMENVYLVTNPAVIEAFGFRVLMYHGASINKFIDEISDIRINFGHRNPARVGVEMLKRRHLAPTHGLMDYIPGENGDDLVIENVPDIFFTADQHRAEFLEYNNILIVSASCWQSTTSFEEKIGNIPEPCRVPVLNLKTREIKILDFSGGKNEDSG
jgi:DNA polymerase II small subunit